MRKKRIQKAVFTTILGCIVCGMVSCGDSNKTQQLPITEEPEEHHAMGTFNEVPADALAGGWIKNGSKGTMTLNTDGSVKLSDLPELNYTGWRQILANVVELKNADGSLDSARIETYDHPMTMKISKRNLSFTHDRP